MPPEVEVLTPEQQQQIWDEVAAERTGTPAETKPTTDAPPEAPTEEPTPTADPAPAEPAAEPTPSTDVKPDTPDPVAELRELNAKLEKRLRGVEAKFGELNGSHKQLQEQLAATQAAAKVSDAPTQAQVAEAITDPREWADLKAEYPTWAEATEKLFEARMAGFRQPTIDPKQIDAIVKEQVQGVTAAMKKEIIDATLEGVLPKWQDEIKSEVFSTWMKAQPEDIQKLAESDSVGDAARMLRLFDDSRRAPPPNPAQELADKRKQTLAQAAATPRGVKVPPTKSPDDMSPEEQWEYEAKQRQKQREARGY